MTTEDRFGMDPPRDAPRAADDFGTTPREMHDGEPLDGRIAREEPDVLAFIGQDADESIGADNPGAGQGVGRLVEPDEGARADTEADMVALDVGADADDEDSTEFTAEESAMHLEPEI